MAEPAKQPKKGLESIVGDLLNLDEGFPAVQKPPAPVNSVVIQAKPTPKPATMPAQGGGGRAPYRGPVVSKGSQIAPKRDSSADYIDGRSDRATGRNSRLNLSLKPEHLDAFKWWVRVNGRRPYNIIIEEWIEANCAQQLQDIRDGVEE